jgi:uncharacterized protein (TIGR03492 family)
VGAPQRRAPAPAGDERRLWLLSNGRAEDLLAASLLARIAPELRDWRFIALPLVGVGEPYDAGPAEVVGPRRRLPADGLTLHHPALAWADLRAGLLAVTWSQLRTLRGGRADAVLVVGDVYAHAMARLLGAARRFVVQPLVSVHMAAAGGRVPWNRAFMERIAAPEIALLRGAEAVYPRDEATAAWLRTRGVRARFLGNPMMDGLAGVRLRPWPDLPTIALLPGSRAHAVPATAVMLRALERLDATGLAVVAAVAWTHGTPPPLPPGWSVADAGASPWTVWCRGGVRVAWVVGRFADVLHTADAVLGTTGTAQEQAAGLGLPVVSFPVAPMLGSAFLANQARLLGEALDVVSADPVAIAGALRRALLDDARRAAARRDGPARLGLPGGTRAIAADVAARLLAPGG